MGMVELCYTGNPPIAGGFVFISHCFINRDTLPIRPLMAFCHHSNLWGNSKCKVRLLPHASWLLCEKCSEASFNYTLQRILHDSLLQRHQLLLLAPMSLIFSLSTPISLPSLNSSSLYSSPPPFFFRLLKSILLNPHNSLSITTILMKLSLKDHG